MQPRADPGSFLFVVSWKKRELTGKRVTAGQRKRESSAGAEDESAQPVGRVHLAGLDPVPNATQQATVCVSLFGHQAPSLEDYSHLPPEQRRKRLQQRIDELNRELQKEMDQR